MRILALIFLFTLSSIASAHPFTFIDCLRVTEWINVTVGARDQQIPYDQVDEAARVHMDAIAKIKPQEAFILDPADDEMFFNLLERVYNSKQTGDEASTNYLTECAKRITPN
jgi:fido (protein-threonine AMPylation protein)